MYKKTSIGKDKQLVSKGCWKLLTNHGKEGDDLSFLSRAAVLVFTHNKYIIHTMGIMHSLALHYYSFVVNL